MTFKSWIGKPLTLRLIPGFAYFIFSIILFRKNIHLLLLYSKHVIKLSRYNFWYYKLRVTKASRLSTDRDKASMSPNTNISYSTSLFVAWKENYIARDMMMLSGE